MGERRDGWARGGWRLAAAPLAPAVAGAVLGLLAVAQAVAAAPALTAAGPASASDAALILVLLGLAGTVPLAAARDHPAPAAVAVTAANVLSLAAVHTLALAALAAQLIVLYLLGRGGAQLLAAVLAVPFWVLAVFLVGTRHLAAEDLLAVVLASLGPAAAWAGAARRARDEAALHSAARQAVAGSLLEHTARGERARISRELHDVVAHHISMISVQAESARLTTPGMPPDGARRLSAIGATARTALTEMRRLLGVLREDTGTAAADRAPQPGLWQLNELIDAVREATGAGTRLIVHGRIIPLAPGAELAAYRIVQEALTNARRHAPGAAVDVELRYSPDALRVRVRDNGPGPPPGGAGDGYGGGHGLAGLRERAVAAGGRLRSGPAAGGGFLVEATLPATAGGDSG